MTCSFFRRGKKDNMSPEISKMNERLLFSKPRRFSLCSSLDSDREDCWNYCPTLPRFYKKEKKQKMVEVGTEGRKEVFIQCAGWIVVSAIRTPAMYSISVAIDYIYILHCMWWYPLCTMTYMYVTSIHVYSGHQPAVSLRHNHVHVYSSCQ